MTIGSVSTQPLPPLSLPTPQASSPSPVDGDGDTDGGAATQSAGEQAADAGSGLPYDPARGRNVNITA